MTRKLPWAQPSRPKASPRAPSTKHSSHKRYSELSDTLSSGTRSFVNTPKRSRAQSPASSSLAPSSPPPEPIIESFMQEGVDKDDGYRMVEDELLRVAKQFTVHIHAAEYKRRQRLERERNGDMINTISRPVVGPMSDHAKRKADRAARLKRQEDAIEELLTRQGRAVDDSDDSADGLPYIGTTLHGLMDSPRKKATSLAKLGMISTTTRASAGFKRGHSQHSNAGGASSLKVEKNLKVARPGVTHQTQVAHDSDTTSDEDDDLDAQIYVPKLATKEESIPVERATTSRSFTQANEPVGPNSGFAQPSPDPLTSSKHSRVAKRLERMRSERVKEEDSELSKPKMDVIPTFL